MMIKNPYHGKYIMGEGEDGAGKTTQMKLLEAKIKAAGLPVLYVKEPSRNNVFGRLAYAIYSYESERDRTEGSVSECLQAPELALMKNEIGAEGNERVLHFESIARDFLAGKDTELPTLLQLSMIFARRELIRAVVMPALEKGVNVLSDRGFFSTLCYGKSEGLDWRELLRLHYEILGQYFIVPDLTFIFDIEIEEALRRKLKQQEGRQDHFDRIELMLKIREAYLALIDEPELAPAMRIQKIDGAPSEAQVQKVVWGYASELLGVR
ncbi:MAG TPA: hypothetical protein VJK04_00245 [Candidatus Paceibacterota bacterium]